MKKILAFLLIAFVLLPVVAASASDDPVSLEVWYAVSGTSGETFTAIANEWDAANDGVTLTLSYSGNSGDSAAKMSAALLSDTYPDVALIYAGPLFTGAHGDYRIGNWVAAGEFGIDDVFSGMWEYCKYADQICAIPYGISTQVLYYNKDILTAAGVDMTNPPETWDAFKAVAAQTVENSNINGAEDFSGFEVSDPVWLIKSMFMQNGCPIVTEEDGVIIPVFNDTQAVQVAEFWKSLVDDGLMPAGEHDNAENKFLSGNCAFIAASSNRITRWTDTAFELGAIEMPSFTTKSIALGGNVLIILTDDPAKEETAKAFVDFITSADKQAEFALATGYLPTHQSALSMDSVQEAIASNELYSIAFNQLSYTWAYTHFEEMGTMDALLWYATNEIEKAVRTPQEALDNAVAELIDDMEY